MRKNFILTMLMFLFINILSIANENLPAVNTNINNMNPAYDESLKEYKIQVENTEKLYNYIEKTIKENSITTVFTKLENSNLVASDENGNSNYTLESNGEKTRIISETLLKKSINGKNIFEIIDLMGDLNISSEKIFAKIENYKSKIYDINNGKLLFSTTYKNGKLEAESQVDETFVKMTYTFDDNNFNKGTVNLYTDSKLFATVRIINSLQEGEMEMFYPNGKVMATSIFKNGKLNGISKMYYDNGKIMLKMNFIDDELNGETILYGESGKIIRKQLYRNGEEVIK